MAKNLSATLPPQNLPFLDDNGNVSLYWHAWMLAIWQRTGGAAGVSSSASVVTANSAQNTAIAAQLTGTTGVTNAALAQTTAAAGVASAASAQVSANIALGRINILNATSVFKGSFLSDGIAASANPVFTGTITMSLLPQAVDDAAAAGLGVAVGSLYANGSQVMQRQS